MKRIILNIVVLITILLEGCSMIKIIITVSDKRDPISQSIQLPNNIKLTSLGAVNINNVDFFPASFRIEAQGKVIYIDPIVIDDAKPADYIFITHAHPDHLSLPDIEKIVQGKTLIICPKKVVNKLSGYKVKEVKPGDVLDFGNIKCEAVAAYNTRAKFLWIKAHSRSAMNVGYILTINGVRLYHAGDTDLIPEMKDMKDITVAMVPIGGDKLTMNPEQAAQAINAMKPQIVVPMHYELGKNYTETFKQLVDKNIQVEIMGNEQ